MAPPDKKRPSTKRAAPSGATGARVRRQGWAEWSPLRKVMAVTYVSAVLAALLGTGLLVLGPSGRPKPVQETAKVVALPQPAPRVLEPETDMARAPEVALPYEEPMPDEHRPPPVTPPVQPKPHDSDEVAPEFSRGKVAIVIDDVGPDVAGSQRSIALFSNVTLSFLPYATRVRQLAAAASAAGHEILVHMPMEPKSRMQNPGPHALLTQLPASELMRRLDWNLAQFDGYVGINNHMGSVFTTNLDDMTPVMEALKSRGLLFLDSRTTDATVAGQVADKVGIPFAARDIFLDNILSADAVNAQLQKVEAIARRHGSAIAIGHPHGVTLKTLEAWLPTLEKKGITLVPLSALVKERWARHQLVLQEKQRAEAAVNPIP